jgi:hypothetical protein
LPETQRRNAGLHVLLAVLVLACFAYNVWKYWFLGDDGFIAFRFAKNLVAGHGVVYNPGERVEGYTQPLWVLLMAGGMALGWAPEIFSCVVGIACGVLILGTLVWFTRRLDPSAGLWVWFAPLCLAVNRSFGAWCTGGLGTQFFALLVLLGAVRFVVEWKEGKSPFGSGLLLAVATVARPEGGLFLAVAGLFLLGDVLVRRRRPLSAAFSYGVPGVILVGAHFLWRHDYYGYWLPNTFYVKVSGFWWEQSSKYLWLFMREHVLYAVLPLLLVLFRRGPVVNWLFLAFIAVYLVYIVYIGGDRFEFRFMTPIMPMLYWLLQSSVRRIHERLTGPEGAGDSGALIRLRRQLSAMMRIRDVAPVLALLVVATSAYSTLHPYTKEYDVNDVVSVGEYGDLRAWEGKFFKRLVDEGYLEPTDLIATRGAGAMPYYSELPILDLHGLNDEHIAHQPIEERGVISHEKVATLEYVLERAPVMVNVRNRFVFEHLPGRVFGPRRLPPEPYFPQPLRAVKIWDHYIMFGTTLDEEAYRKKFARFEILR